MDTNKPANGGGRSSRVFAQNEYTELREGRLFTVTVLPDAVRPSGRWWHRQYHFDDVGKAGDVNHKSGRRRRRRRA